MRKVVFLLLVIVVLAFLLAGCGGGESEAPADEPVSEGDAVAGEGLYQSTCSACHGPDATGMPNLGKDMTTSEFIHDNSDAELLAFIKQGRPVGDPANTTNVDMPPKGGNPALSDEDILNIIAFIRTLEQ